MAPMKKKRQLKPFGSIVRTNKALRSSFQEKEQERLRRQHFKEAQDGMKEAVKKKKEVSYPNIHCINSLSFPLTCLY